MTSSLLRPAFVLWCAALVALGSQQPAEAAGNDPYLVVQHQVYEEHQEVVARNASKRSKGAYRKDDDELFDFIKDYLFRRGGAMKLRSRSSDGKAQFMGVDAGDEVVPAKKDSAESDRRYKMHIIKFRLVNRSDPVVAGGVRSHGLKAKAARKQGTYAFAPHGPRYRESGDGSAHGAHYGQRSASLGGRSTVDYTSSHPTHATTSSVPPPPKAPAAGNCELPATTSRSTTTRKTTTHTKKTTTTTKTTTKTTTTTTPKTTTTRTTTCATTTVNVIGCDRPLPSSTKTTTSTTTTASQKPYLHGHPFVVIKVHEVPGTPPTPAGSSPKPWGLSVPWRHRDRNDTHTQREHNDSSSHFELFRHRQHGLAEEGGRRRARRYPSYAAETAALKQEVAGNLMHVLRTIRQLDTLAREPQQDAPPNPELDVDRLLTARERHKEPRTARKKTTDFPDELRENEAEEGDLHQFSILLKKALDELSVPSTTRRRRSV